MVALRRGPRRLLLAGEVRQRLDDPARAQWIDPHTGAHREGERDRLEIAALRGSGPCARELLYESGVVLEQLGSVEVGSPDHHVDDGLAVGAVLDLAGLRLG